MISKLPAFVEEQAEKQAAPVSLGRGLRPATPDFSYLVFKEGVIGQVQNPQRQALTGRSHEKQAVPAHLDLVCEEVVRCSQRAVQGHRCHADPQRRGENHPDAACARRRTFRRAQAQQSQQFTRRDSARCLLPTECAGAGTQLIFPSLQDSSLRKKCSRHPLCTREAQASSARSTDVWFQACK